MRKISRGEVTKPWDASSSVEAILDTMTLGVTRERRARRIRAEYARLDKYRLQEDDFSREVTPQLLPELVPDAKTRKIAQLALEIVCDAESIYISTFQGYGATLTRGADGSRRASLHTGYRHEPTLYRVREATGRDYEQDLRNSQTLVALVTRKTFSVEGLGAIANEYSHGTSQTGRVTDASFLIRGLSRNTVAQFVSILREHPAEMLDGVMYTAFADAEIPGRSLLQAQLTDRPADSLFIPGACSEVMVVAAPKQ